MSEVPAVTVTFGSLGEGEETVELGAGDDLTRTFDGPAYIEIDVADGSDVIMVEAVNTEKQSEGSDDREWTVETTKCVECGKRFPADYSNCPECGTENYEVEEQ